MDKRKKIILGLVMAVMLIGAASGSLLNYFNSISQEISVSQSVTVDGQEYGDPISNTFEATGGGVVIDGPHEIQNNAEVPITVQLTSTNYNGINTVYGNELILENKDSSNWNTMTGDGIQATLRFGLIGDKFNYSLDATGLDASTEYVLIYYADQQDRYTNWGGNPALKLGEMTADSNGDLSVQESVEINSDLPYEDDWNNGPEANYCEDPDNYDHCTGAKIWLIPKTDWQTNDGREGELSAWNPDDYLFETDMVRYFDNTEDKLTIPPGGSVEVYIVNELSSALQSGTYVIDTYVSPVE